MCWTATLIDPAQDKTGDASGSRIRCPLCGGSPRKEDSGSWDCGHQWNTFDTGGVCPSLEVPNFKWHVGVVPSRLEFSSNFFHVGSLFLGFETPEKPKQRPR